MSVSTTERPAALRPHSVHNARLADLVRTIDGVGAPAARPWEIVTGQRLELVTAGLRRRVLEARVPRGTLTVTDDLLGSTLDFSVLVTDTNDRVDIATRVTSLVAVDWWQAAGTAVTTRGCHPVSLCLGYNGVYRHGGRLATLWLTVHATVDLPEPGITAGRRTVDRLRIAADFNLQPRLPGPP